MKGSTIESHELQFSDLNDGYYGCVWGYTWLICSATPWLVYCKDENTAARVQATSSLLFCDEWAGNYGIGSTSFEKHSALSRKQRHSEKNIDTINLNAFNSQFIWEHLKPNLVKT